MCCEPYGEQVTEGENFAFVGQGRGPYEMHENISYVGQGGSYDREKIVRFEGWRCRFCCVVLLALLLVAGIIALVILLLPNNSSYRQEDQQSVTSMAFDCDAGYWNWDKGWSYSKQQWCCLHHNRGCSTSVAPTSFPFDCDAGFSNWRAGWGPAKKSWCCSHYNKGCVASMPYDCNAGYSNWQSGWSHGKKQWCCTSKGRGCAVKKSCSLWGDPHISTFDHSRLVFYSTGDFWIVKSPVLSIQGRFQATDWTKKNDKTDYSSMTQIVVSGHIVGNHKIQIGPMGVGGKITCDGHNVLNFFGSSKCGTATVSYDDKGQLVDSAMAFLPHKVVHIYSLDGISIQVNRWPNFINAKITMSPATGMTGICGDFNGIAKKGLEAGKQLHAQFGYGVPAHELLFPDSIALKVPQAMPSSKRCSDEQLQRAQHICHNAVKTTVGWSVAECLGDVCDTHISTADMMKAQMT